MKTSLILLLLASLCIVLFLLNKDKERGKEILDAQQTYRARFDSLNTEQFRLQQSIDSLKVVSDSLSLNYEAEKEIVIGFDDKQTLDYFLKQTSR